MLRVLMLLTDLEPGGTPLRLARLARWLRRVDVEPVVGCLAPRGPLCSELEADGIETFSCNARGPLDATCLLRLAKHIRRVQPDLIHSTLFHANLAARLVGRRDHRRPVITSTVTIEIERSWHRWLEALTAGASDLHVANSIAVARHVRDDLGFAPDHVEVVPNGLDFAAIDRARPVNRTDVGLREDVPLVVWAGRMDPVKDLTTFVRTIDRVRRQRDVTAVLLGDGPQRSQVQALVDSLELNSVIRVALWSDDVIGWFKTADAMLFTSRTEGSPNAVIEAMACGCAVVASDIPSCRELIAPGALGCLCPPGDVQSFAGRLAEILTKPILRRRYAQKAAAHVRERHDIQHVVCRWRRLYDRVLTTG